MHAVSAYIRTSTEDQTTQQQKDAILAAYNDDTHIIFYEEQLSGWKEQKRPKFDLLRKNIEHGQVKEVVVYSVSRLGRSVRDAFYFADLCDRKGVRLKVLCENLDFSGPLGKVLLLLFSALAEMDSDVKSQRIRDKFRLQKKEGKFIAHGCPPGTISEKLKRVAPEVYLMHDNGRPNKYIARTLGITERSVMKLLAWRGKELLTRAEYAKRFPDWHRLPREQRPEVNADHPMSQQNQKKNRKYKRAE